MSSQFLIPGCLAYKSILKKRQNVPPKRLILEMAGLLFIVTAMGTSNLTIWKEMFVANMRTLYGNSLGDTEEKHKKKKLGRDNLQYDRSLNLVPPKRHRLIIRSINVICKHHATKTNGGVEAQYPALLTSALN
jgi:hypothetical protein